MSILEKGKREIFLFALVKLQFSSVRGKQTYYQHAGPHYKAHWVSGHCNHPFGWQGSVEGQNPAEVWQPWVPFCLLGIPFAGRTKAVYTTGPEW